MMEVTSQLQANQDRNATRKAHNAIRQVSWWIVSSRCPVPTEVLLAAGRKITASNKNRLAIRIEADRCNQRTNTNANVMRIARCAPGGGPSAAQSNSNVKFPVVTWVSTETARHTTLYLPGFSSGRET